MGAFEGKHFRAFEHNTEDIKTWLNELSPDLGNIYTMNSGDDLYIWAKRDNSGQRYAISGVPIVGSGATGEEIPTIAGHLDRNAVSLAIVNREMKYIYPQ